MSFETHLEELEVIVAVNVDNPKETRCCYCMALSSFIDEDPIGLDPESIDKHLNGTSHWGAVHFLNSFGVYVNKKGLYCKLCNLTLVPDNDLVVLHLYSYAHRKDFSDPTYYDCEFCGANIDIDYYFLHSFVDCNKKNILVRVSKMAEKEGFFTAGLDDDENPETDATKLRDEYVNFCKSLIEKMFKK